MMVHLGTVVTLMVALSVADASYMLVFSKNMDIGEKLDVYGYIDDGGSSFDTTLYISPHNDMETKLVQKMVTFDSTNPTHVSLQVPGDLSTSSLFDLCATELPGKKGPTCKAISPQQKKSNVFIQTDKPLYKPGEKVKIRGLCLNLELKPDKNVDSVIKIEDPEGNILLLKSEGGNDDPKSALRSAELRLSDEPILGNYSITLSCNGITEKVYIDVLEYVLPKFSVDLTVDKSYVVNGDVSINGKVRVKYTYGKPVEGDLDLYLNEAQTMLTKKLENGEHEFDIGLSEKALKSGRFNVTAVVSEKGSGVKAHETVLLPYYMSDFEVKIVEPIPKFIKEDMNYTFQARVSRRDGGNLQNLVQMGYLFQVDAYTTGGVKQTYSADATENPITFVVPRAINVKTLIDFERGLTVNVSRNNGNSKLRTESSTAIFYPLIYKSTSGDGLRVMVNYNGNKKEACVKIEPVESLDKVFYQVINSFNAEPIQKYVAGSSCFEVQSKHAPKSKIVAYKMNSYTTGTGRDMQEQEEWLIADTVLTLPYQTDQKVTFTLDPETVKPGENVKVMINSNGRGGFAAVSAADRSVSLMSKEGNNINEDKIVKTRAMNTMFYETEGQGNGPVPFFRKKRSICFRCGGWNDNTLTPMETLLDNGLDIMTDSNVYNDQPYYEDAVADNEEDKTNSKVEAGNAPPATVRSYFPETWLWDIVDLDNEGKGYKEVKVPDTITKWDFTSFVLDNTYGLGVAAAELTVFQPFFLSMNLPYSIVRGEKFALEILVFNYQQNQLEVMVVLDNPAEFESSAQERKQNITVAAGSSNFVVVNLRAKKIGDITLRARATDRTNNVDIVKRIILSKPEGIKKLKEMERPLSVPEQKETTVELKTLIPEESIVSDSLRVYMKVKADLMGGADKNLKSSIRMPYGCGEQNLISLTPAVYIGMYLIKIGLIDEGTRQLISDACAAGYSKELIYKHRDGSFSAFGESNGCGCFGRAPPGKDTEQKPKPGSTWLTAYVLKMFSIVAREEFTFVSQDILEEAFHFLNSKFDKTAGFIESGHVIHKEMQGNTGKGPGLTAFCLNAILEFKTLVMKLLDNCKEDEMGCSREERTKLQSMISKIDYIVGQATAMLTTSTYESSYLAAISAYSFAKAGNVTLAKVLLDNIKARNESELSTNDDDIPCGQNLCIQPRRGGYGHHQSVGTKVEAIGYRLLAYIALGKKSVNSEEQAMYKGEALLLVLELVKLRNADGTFSSTQATSVGFAATSAFAIAYPETRNTDFQVVAKRGSDVVSDRVEMNNENEKQMISVKLDGSFKPTDVLTFAVSGTGGTAFVTVVVIYNTDNSSKSTLDLKYEPKINRNGENVLRLQVLTQKNASVSSMVVVQVNSPTGMCLKMDIGEVTDIQRIERLGECGISVYYMTTMPGGFKPRPFDVPYETLMNIEDRQSAVITVTDYYEQENNKEVLYNLPTKAPRCIKDCDTVDGVTGLNSNIFLLISTCAMLITCYVI